MAAHQKNKTQGNVQLVSKLLEICNEKLKVSTNETTILLDELRAKKETVIASDQNLKIFKEAREMIMARVTQLFENLEQEYKKYIKEFATWKINAFEAAEKRLTSQKIEIDGLIEQMTNQDKGNTLKVIKFSFLKDFSKEIHSIKDHMDSINKKKLEFDIFKNDGKVEEALKLIKGSFIVKAMKQNEKTLEETKGLLQQERETKAMLAEAAEKAKIPSKEKCPTCGNKMTYVSEFKKHMICANCQQIKRLYLQKKKS